MPESTRPLQIPNVIPKGPDRKPMRKPIAGLGLLITALGIACASPPPKHEYTLVPGHAYHPSITKAILLPVNTTEEIESGLEVADHKLDRFLKEHLASKGLRTYTPSRSDYQKALEKALQQARDAKMSGTSGKTSGTLEFGDLVPFILAEIDPEAQLLLSSNVVIRSGRYSGGRMIRWDGVRRRETVMNLQMSGMTRVASLHTMIFAADGQRIFTAYGGLDTIYELDEMAEKYVVKEDRLQDESHLREGVCISLHPFFGEQEPCSYY